MNFLTLSKASSLEKPILSLNLLLSEVLSAESAKSELYSDTKGALDLLSSVIHVPFLFTKASQSSDLELIECAYYHLP